MVPERDGFLTVTSQHRTQPIGFPPSQNISLLIFPLHIFTPYVNASSLAGPFLSPVFPSDVHTSLPALCKPHISVRHFFWAPVRRAQICSGLTSHHVSPTGSDLAKTRAALGVMNQRFIFLGHMWVKLFDVNHTLTASACNRRVTGCHSLLAALSPHTVLLL